MSEHAGHIETAKQTNRFLFSLSTGFFAGLIWGLIKVLGYYIGFTKVIPGFLAEPFFKSSQLSDWSGHLLGLGFFILFSILAALLYGLLLYKLKGPWFGLMYGGLWWAILFLGIGPPLQMVKWINHLDMNSIISEICLFLLWGIFIGYTISFEFNDERVREPFTNFDEKEQT